MWERRIAGWIDASLAVVLATLVSTTASTAAAQPDEEGIYQELAEQATGAVTEGRLDDAYARFLEMHAIRPSARTFWSLGRVRFEQERYAEALTHLDAALANPERRLEGEARTSARALRDRARSLTAVLHIDVTPREATRLVDDMEVEETVVRLDPGEHRIRAELAGHEPAVRRVRLRPGERRRLTLTLEPRPPPVSVDLEARLAAAVTPPEPESESPILLRLRGAPGLTLHLQALPTEAEATVHPARWQAVCTAPCEASLPPARYLAAVERDGEMARVAAAILTLSDDEELSVDYIDRSDLRLTFGLIGLVQTLIGVALAATGIGFAVSNDENGSQLGEGFGIAGAAVGFTGLFWLAGLEAGDAAAIVRHRQR